MSAVPKLRFPEFDGEWCDQKLKENILLISGQHLSPEEYSDNGKFPYFTGPTDFTDDKSKVKKWTATTRSVAPSGSILITVKGSGVGEMAQTKLENVVIGRQLMSIEGDNASTGFLYQYLLKKRQLMKALASGNMIPGLSRADLFSLSVSIPSLPEQQKIASVLSSVDKKIDLLHRKKNELELYKKGLMQKVFSQEVRFKQDDGSDFPDWEEVNLPEIGKVIGGGTPDSGIERYWGGEINWFTPSEVKQKYLFGSLRKITIEGLKGSSAKLLPKNAILLTSRANIGDVAILKKESATNQGFQSIVTHSEHNHEFVYYLLLHNKNAFLRKASGSTFLEISKSEVSKISFLVPSLAEQNRIATAFESAESKIDYIASQIEQIETFKKGLLQQMFV